MIHMILCIILLVILWFHLQYRLWDIENKIKHIADITKLTNDLLGIKQTYRISKSVLDITSY